MQRNLIALAVLSVLSTVTLAEGNHYPQGNSSTSVNSLSEVNVQSNSTFGTNQGAAHFSAATAQNTSTANEVSGSHWGVSAAATNATTVGTTTSVAGGIGNGYAGADANQYGEARAVAQPSHNLSVSSEAGVHTFSVAEVQNTGLAVSGSIGGATNTSAGLTVFGHSTATSAGIDGGAGGGFELGNGSYSTGGSTYQQGNSTAGHIHNID